MSESLEEVEGKFWIQKSWIGENIVIYEINIAKGLPREFDEELMKLVNKYAE